MVLRSCWGDADSLTCSPTGVAAYADACARLPSESSTGNPRPRRFDVRAVLVVGPTSIEQAPPPGRSLALRTARRGHTPQELQMPLGCYAAQVLPVSLSL